MKITFLGTGGVFDYEYGSSSAIVYHGGKNYLIDCGPSVYPSLRQHELVDLVDFVLLTHLHGDHVGSLFQLIMHRKGRSGKRLVILLPAEPFWKEVDAFLSFSLLTPSNYVDFAPLNEVSGVHALDTTDKHIPGMRSYAYYFVDGPRLLFYSGDLGDVNVTVEFLKTRTEQEITVYHEMHHLHGSAHVHYRELMERLAGYRVYGYHCDPRKIPPDNTIPLVADNRQLLFG